MSAKLVCEKIRSLYPEVGSCGEGLSVAFDGEKESWTVGLSQRNRSLETHLEPDDVTTCLEEERCVPLAIQVQQLVDNVQRL